MWSSRMSHMWCNQTIRVSWSCWTSYIFWVSYFVSLYFIFKALFIHLQWGNRWRSGSSPTLCTTECGFNPSSGAVCAFGFQSILASAGFSPDSPVFLLHLKLGFLNRSISGNVVWSYGGSADALIPLFSLCDISHVSSKNFFFFCRKLH